MSCADDILYLSTS